MTFTHTILRTDPTDDDKQICIDLMVVGDFFPAIPGDRINQPEPAYFELQEAYYFDTRRRVSLTLDERLEIEQTIASENNAEAEQRLMRSLFLRTASRI